MGALVSVLFFADIVWLQGGALDTALVLQITLFGAVALATGVLGDRLRRAGARLGAVESELRQLRLDTTEILDSLTTGVLTVDRDGRLVYLNHAGARLLGVDAAGHLGKPVDQVLGRVAPGMGRLLLRSLVDRVPVLRSKTTLERAQISPTLSPSRGTSLPSPSTTFSVTPRAGTPARARRG